MKSLMLLRHAEALSATPALTDIDRVLSLHGKRQARRLGKWLGAHGWAPQRILCSSAVRARQTADAVTAAAEWNTPMLVLERLYNASADELLGVLHEQATDIDGVLLIAHAPGIGELASALTTRQADLSLNCEPATLIEVVVAVDRWSDVKRNCGKLNLLLPSLSPTGW